MAEKTLKDVIDRLIREGELVRNDGANSIRSVKEMLKSESSKDSTRFEDLRDAITNQSSRIVKAQLKSVIPPSEREEVKREQDAFKDSQLEALNKIADRLSLTERKEDTAKAKEARTQGPGLLSSVGGLFKGILGGAGLLAGGLGVLAGGGAFLIDRIVDLDVDKLKSNVTGLLAIGDEFENGNWQFLAEGGAFGLAMAGIGAGLGVFAAGSAIAAATDYFAREGWAERVKSNVLTLLSISDEKGQIAALQGLALGPALAVLGGGLAAFSVSAAVANGLQLFEREGWADQVVDNVRTLLQISEMNQSFGPLQGIALGAALGAIGAGLTAFSLGQGVQAAVQYFSKVGWADDVVHNVGALLSLNKGLGALANVGAAVMFGPMMSLIGAGLAVFGVGGAIQAGAEYLSEANWASTLVDNVNTLLSLNKGLDALVNLGATTMFAPMMAGIAAGLAVFGAGQTGAAIGEFLSKQGWAQTIVDNVETLLTISQLPIDAAVEATSQLGLLGSGLAVFGIGTTATAIGETIASENWTQKLVDNVKSLLQVTQIEGIKEGSTDFAFAMGKIGIGLSAFAAGQFVQTLASAGEAVLGFFGVDSPFDKMLTVADNADDLEKGSLALDRIGSALAKFNSIKVSDVDIDFEKLATDLATTIPLMEKLAFGGIYDPGFFSRDIDFGKGILDPALKIDEIADKINKVNQILGNTTIRMEPPAVVAPEMTSRELQATQMNQADRENRELSTQNTALALDASQVDNSMVVNNNNTTAALINNNMPTVDTLDRTYQ